MHLLNMVFLWLIACQSVQPAGLPSCLQHTAGASICSSCVCKHYLLEFSSCTACVSHIVHARTPCYGMLLAVAVCTGCRMHERLGGGLVMAAGVVLVSSGVIMAGRCLSR